MNERILLDPTSERFAAKRAPVARLASIEGATVGLLDISKARGDVFLDELESLFAKRGATVKRYAKPTFARVAPEDIRQRIASECHAVVEALAD